MNSEVWISSFIKTKYIEIFTFGKHKKNACRTLNIIYEPTTQLPLTLVMLWVGIYIYNASFEIFTSKISEVL